MLLVLRHSVDAALALDVALQEGRRVLVDVQREAVVRPFAVVAVHARSHSVFHDVLADALQLVLSAILQVKKRFQTYFPTLQQPANKENIVVQINMNKKKKNQNAQTFISISGWLRCFLHLKKAQI